MAPLAKALATVPWYGEAPAQALRACLGFIASLEVVQEVVVGAHEAAQLEAIISGLRAPPPTYEWSRFALPDEWVDPRNWF